MIATVHGNQTDPMYTLAVLFRMEIEKNIKYEKGFFKTFFLTWRTLKPVAGFILDILMFTLSFPMNKMITNDQTSL